jgi:hypothetical protein
MRGFNMSSIKIYFTKSNTLMSWIVRLTTCSKYSHVEVSVGDSFYSAKAFKGVYKRNKKEFFEDESCIEMWTVNGLHQSDVERVTEFLDGSIGAKYDYLPAIGLGLLRTKLFSQNSSKWFCSELISTALSKSSRPIINKHIQKSRVTPNDLRYSPELDYVFTYKGRNKRGFIMSFLRFFW